MIEQKAVEDDLSKLNGVVKSYPYDKKSAVYSVGNTMIGLLEEGTMPVRINLRSDPKLSAILREKYETIMPAQKLDKELWNTVILSGQLSQDQLRDLIRHAYELGLKAEAKN